MYVLQDVPGKGQGLVAMKDISKGTRILSEEAVIAINAADRGERLQTSICHQVEALSDHQRRAFLSMHNIHPFKNAFEQYLGIFRTNSLPAEEDGDKWAIFPEACRINHACDNNSQKNFNEKIKKHTVHALRDISKGEEITITYLGPLKSRNTRQRALQEQFDFTCLCRLCSLPPEQSRDSDRRLEEIHRLDGTINQLGMEGILRFPSQTLLYFDRQVRLYNEQSREDVGLAHAFVNAAQLAITNSDLARGRIFAEKAASMWTTTLGSDSMQAIHYGALAHDPSKYELYGISAKWKTKVDEVPQGLEQTDFEDWLWRREKKQQSLGKPANLPSRVNFLGFSDLPDENDINPEFYESSHVGLRRPRRHWCFLGEIVGFATLLRLQMDIKDTNDATIPLFFYTDDRGSELAPAQVQKGYTVAVLYAERHKFLYADPGIRHENPRMIKVQHQFVHLHI